MFSGFEILVAVERTQLTDKMKKDFRMNFRVPISIKGWHSFFCDLIFGKKGIEWFEETLKCV